MITFAKTFARIALATGIVVTSIAAASAANGNGNNGPNAAVVAAPQPAPIAVPAPVPSQPNYVGSWQINQQLYGPYYMTFRLNSNGGGNYQVSGGGLYCNGNLSWYRSGTSARINLQYSNCGNGVGWSADRMSCQFTNYYGNNFAAPGNQPNAAVVAAPQPAPIAVPAPIPASNTIRCTYQPAVYGYQAISVIANRY